MSNAVTLDLYSIDPTNEKPATQIGTFLATEGIGKALAHTLDACKTRDAVKFKPKYQVTLKYADKSTKDFLILGRYVKREGASYNCSDDVERMAEELRSSKRR